MAPVAGLILEASHPGSLFSVRQAGWAGNGGPPFPPEMRTELSEKWPILGIERLAGCGSPVAFAHCLMR